MQILGASWFCGRSNIGIVRVQTDHHGIQYYIGICGGNDVELDKQHIAETGSTFPRDAGDVLFGFSLAGREPGTLIHPETPST